MEPMPQGRPRSITELSQTAQGLPARALRVAQALPRLRQRWDANNAVSARSRSARRHRYPHGAWAAYHPHAATMRRVTTWQGWIASTNAMR